MATVRNRTCGFAVLTQHIHSMCNLTLYDLEIVRQFRPSGIPRIHCNTYEARWFERDGGSFEDKGTEVGNDSSLDGQDLLGYHGEYLVSGG